MKKKKRQAIAINMSNNIKRHIKRLHKQLRNCKSFTKRKKIKKSLAIAEDSL